MANLTNASRPEVVRACRAAAAALSAAAAAVASGEPPPPAADAWGGAQRAAIAAVWVAMDRFEASAEGEPAAFFQGGALLCRALAPAARALAPALPRALAGDHARLCAALATALLNTYLALCACCARASGHDAGDERRPARAGGAPRPAPAEAAALAAAAPPLLDLWTAFYSAGGPRVLGDPRSSLGMLELLGELGQAPFEGGAAALRRLLPPARFAADGTLALDAAAAELGRRAPRAPSSDDLSTAFICLRACQRRAAALAGAALPWVAAAAEARGEGVDFALVAHAAYEATWCARILLTHPEPDGPPPAAAAWTPWLFRRAALAAAAVVRWGARCPEGAGVTLAPSVQLALNVFVAACGVLEPGCSDEAAQGLGALAAALGEALARALGAPRVEALARRAGAALVGAPASPGAGGAMALTAEEMAAPPGFDPRCALTALLALLPAARAADPGVAGSLAAAVEALAARWTDWELATAPRAASPLEFVAAAQAIAGTIELRGEHDDAAPGLCLLRNLATWWASQAGAPRGAAPGAAHHAAVLAGVVAARRLLLDAGDGERAAFTSALAAASLLALAAGAPGALRAAGAADLRAAARRAFRAREAAFGDPGCVTLCAEAAEKLLCAPPAGGARAAARLLVAAGVARELALWAAARWRARAAVDGDAAGPVDKGVVGGYLVLLRERHRLAAVLAGCWAYTVEGAAEPGEGLEYAAARRREELADLDERWGEEEALAEEYEALAAQFSELEAPLEEAFERDEAPALRLAAARAAADHFGCSNLLCARTAGLPRADARALFPARRCSRCAVARYCSAECQAADWRAGHRGVCRELAAEREAAE